MFKLRILAVAARFQTYGSAAYTCTLAQVELEGVGKVVACVGMVMSVPDIPKVMIRVVLSMVTVTVLQALRGRA